jgi:predicted aspartyl protease
MHRSLLVFALGVLAGSSALSAQPVTPSQPPVGGDGMVDRTTQTEDLKFKNDLYDRMTVPVRLSGTGPYRFLVDTGADRTAISREIAAKLNLTSGEKASLHSIAGISTVSTATVPDLQVTRKNVQVVDAPVLESSNMGADGILGTDSLKSQRVLFDFEGQTLSVVPSKKYDASYDPSAIVITAKNRNGRLIITEATANGRRLTVILDTGAQVSIGNSALRKELMGRGGPGGVQVVQLQSVTGGMIAGDYTFARDLQMGGITLNNLPIVFADAHTFKTLGLDKKPALLLGMNALRAFKRVSIDFANRTFRVVLPEHSENAVRMASRL